VVILYKLYIRQKIHMFLLLTIMIILIKITISDIRINRRRLFSSNPQTISAAYIIRLTWLPTNKLYNHVSSRPVN